MADMGKAFPTTNGVWSATTKYERLCIVTYNGSSYISTNSTINDVPGSSSNWQLISQKGISGEVGPKGRDAPLDYLTGAVQPINQWSPFWSNTGLNNDGTGGSVGGKPGWSYNVYHRQSYSDKGPFDRIVRLFDGKNDDIIRFFWYKQNASVAMGSVTKTVGTDGSNFDLDQIIPEDANNCAVEYSRGVSGKIAVYSRYADLLQYLPAPDSDNHDVTIYSTLFGGLSGSIAFRRHHSFWSIDGVFTGYQNDADDVFVCGLPFSVQYLETFQASSDSGGYVTMLLKDSNLYLYRAKNSGDGAVRIHKVFDVDLINGH